MKTAGIALSIIGVVLAIISALIYLAAAIAIVSPGFLTQTENASFDIAAILAPISTILALVLGVCAFMGIVAAVKLSKKGLTAGILLVTSAVLCAVTIYGILAAVCFLLAGIFSFVADKRAPLDPAPLKINEADEDDDPEEYDMGL